MPPMPPPHHLPELLPLVLFILTYLGIALGRLPGLAVDRTGVAMLGAAAFLLTGSVSLAEAQSALNAPTLCVLFGMMLLSAQYRYSGLYAAISDRLAGIVRARRLLLCTICVVAPLSALLTNDVICFALTPLLIAVVVRTGRPPMPFLAAIACASNLGSALTPIGNPQNILIAQSLHLAFLPFVLVCSAPVILSLAALYLLLRHRLPADPAVLAVAAARAAAPLAEPVDRWQAGKAVALTVVAIALFLSPVPAALTALAVGAAVLASRRLSTLKALGEVDWSLLALFVSLFVVQRGIEGSGWTTVARDAMFGAGLNLAHPAVLVPTAALLSDLVSNVPAVMLLLPFVAGAPGAGYALALASTLAGNAVLVGSIANLIVAAQAERFGLRFGFSEHLRTGLPVALISLALSAADLMLLAGH
jgi:Na+/H+ antiporter NhaD/arsenite permease-like protein